MAVKKKAAPKPNQFDSIEQERFARALANRNVETDTSVGGFTPVVPTGTITLANGDVMEVASGKIIGPVDSSKGKPGDFTDPTFKPYVMPKDTKDVTKQTNQIYILIAKLKAVGIPEALANRAGAFFTALQDDGIDDEDNMIDIFLNAKSYKAKKTGQEIASPYYQDFGKFNDGLSSAKPPGVLVPWVLGIREVVKKYDTNGTLSLYATDESIQKYLKNGTQVSVLDDNFNQARLRGITADPVYIDTLTKMGYIKTAADLTGFFASPELGQQQLETNRNSAAFGAEALRRAKEGGVQLDTEFAKKEAARLTAEGYKEAQISSIAEKGYQQIARNIMPTVKVSGIYQGAQAATAGTIQSELQQQEFMGMDSQRYEMLAEQEARAFQGSSGNIRSPRISSYRDDITGQI
jgi:hypothetical protein